MFKYEYVLYTETVLEKEYYCIYRKSLFGDVFVSRYEGKNIAQKVWFEMNK